MSESLLEGLNASQLEAVTHVDGPLLIVAGAGTGKTTVLTRRYAHLLASQQVTPDRILALTFTEKAAGEMEDRVLQLLSTGTYDFWISTFHGFCQRVLEDHALEIGLPNAFRLLTPTDAWLLLKRRFAELPLEHYRPLGNPTKFLRALLQHISRAKDEGISPEMYQEFVQSVKLEGDEDVVESEKKRLQELSSLYSTYRRLLYEEGCLDFGDLILETLRLFRQRPHVLDAYRQQFRFIMVDEFQDTNFAQYELLKLLSGEKRNLTVVGDDDQAVYKFRGASLANILQFRDDFPDAKTVALTHNYRSHHEILDVAYRFIKKNDPHRLEVRLQATGLSKKLEAIKGAGGKVNVHWYRTIEDEADAVAEQMLNLKKHEPDTAWNDMAVLVRSNDGAEPFIRTFERLGIPFQFMAMRGLYTKTPVLDVIALLSLVDGYHESPMMWRALSLTCYAFPTKDMAELLHLAQNRQGIPLWTSLKQETEKSTGKVLSDEGLKIGRNFIEQIEELAEAARHNPPVQILQRCLEKTGYLASMLRLPEREKREALQWMNAFADRIRRYESLTHDPSLKGFLEEFRQEIDSGEEGALDHDPDAGPDMVKILTVHAAKGLEYKHVFVVSLVDQRFPTRARGEAIPLPDGLAPERMAEGDLHIQEERRLFYVALTRAKQTLMLTGASQYGGSRQKKPSVFFEEASLEIPAISLDLVDEAKRLAVSDGKDAWAVNEPQRVLYPLKRRFSFTQLAAFRKCPLQYKFEHIYRIPKFGTYQKSFGQSIHLTMQRMLELHLMRGQAKQSELFGNALDAPVNPTAGGFRVSQEESFEIFNEVWIDEWYENRERHDEYKQKGRMAIVHFWNACAAAAPRVVEVEKDFTLILGQHSIKGKIDRVDQLDDDTVMILDYKTGSTKEKLETEDKEQLYLYQVALEERGIKVGRMAYIYVLEWQIREVEPLVGAKREAFLEKLSERMDAILLSDFQPTPDVNVCKFCDFRHICEFRKS